MKHYLIIILTVFLPLQAQIVNDHTLAKQMADSIMIKGMGESFFKQHISFNRLYTYENKGSLWADTAGITHNEITTEVWYQINIYGKTDSMNVYLSNRYNSYQHSFSYGDPAMPKSLQDPSQYPIMSKNEFMKAFRKKKGLWKTLTFEFREDGVIAFFTARTKDPKRPNCVFSDAINLQVKEDITGHWWCEN